MRVESPAQSILKTGSFSGLRALEELGHGYLTADKSKHQALCGNSEGWGPLSKFRYDFTPCFMDVWVSSVAVFGILFGAIAVWWLIKRKQKTRVEKDWHFWTKQVWKLRLQMQQRCYYYCMRSGLWLIPSTGNHWGNRNSYHRPTSHSNPKLPRYLGWGLSILDFSSYYPFPRRYIHNSMARARQTPKPKRSRTFLLALHLDCLFSKTSLSDLTASLRRSPALLYCILYWIWAVVGRVWIGMVGAEKDEFISCHWRRR